MRKRKAPLTMGLFDNIRALVNSVETEYDRRIRAASNVRQYQIGGHGAHGDEHHAEHENGHPERQQGEGGALGDLQSNAGPQHGDGH
ncbi:MAG TPA: hypothetical protein VEZ12_18840 [Herpetosiphonaceae bacterium]|nr:hypothetical protein [Herpetosiphonaceae bacterium]